MTHAILATDLAPSPYAVYQSDCYHEYTARLVARFGRDRVIYASARQRSTSDNLTARDHARAVLNAIHSL